MNVTKQLLQAFKSNDTVVVDWHEGSPLELAFSRTELGARTQATSIYSTDTDDFRISHVKNPKRAQFVMMFLDQDTAMRSFARMLRVGDIIGFEAMHDDNAHCRENRLHLEVLHGWILRRKRNGCVTPLGTFILDYNVRQGQSCAIRSKVAEYSVA